MTNTAEYWVGALAMTLAIAHKSLRQGRTDMAVIMLDNALEEFARSPLFEEALRKEMATHWEPREEMTNDRNVLRPLRSPD